MNIEWAWAVIFLPVLAGLFKKEIIAVVSSYGIYRQRSFDLDGNPSTSDRVQILCSATGKWIDATIKYKFSLRSKKRGVYIEYYDGGREKVGFLRWSEFRKRVPPPGGTIR